MNNMFAIAAAAVCAFAICAFTGPFMIPALRRLKFGQEIREIGPSWHKSKSGTPTMGGLMFILAVAVSGLCFSVTDAVLCL